METHIAIDIGWITSFPGEVEIICVPNLLTVYRSTVYWAVKNIKCLPHLHCNKRNYHLSRNKYSFKHNLDFRKGLSCFIKTKQSELIWSISRLYFMWFNLQIVKWKQPYRDWWANVWGIGVNTEYVSDYLLRKKKYISQLKVEATIFDLFSNCLQMSESFAHAIYIFESFFILSLYSHRYSNWYLFVCFKRILAYYNVLSLSKLNITCKWSELLLALLTTFCML